ncbi:hypothetical protein KKF81_03610 [Candidatus Micrarchaeota archaeon]|nr:hypothetical protein [Candidatus Micrarchaeota archaeon]MBU1166011.1 hypothetical protein [Candidatus Micrarchaeota archaeon]MBU1886931.1 hypothetical protein [Candidatus Micrarchaeota archaeon]
MTQKRVERTLGITGVERPVLWAPLDGCILFDPNNSRKRHAQHSIGRREIRNRMGSMVLRIINERIRGKELDPKLQDICGQIVETWNTVYKDGPASTWADRVSETITDTGLTFSLNSFMKTLHGLGPDDAFLVAKHFSEAKCILGLYIILRARQGNEDEDTHRYVGHSLRIHDEKDSWKTACDHAISTHIDTF